MGTTTFSGPVKSGPVISGSTSGGYRGKDLKDTNWVASSMEHYFNEPAAADTNGICTAQTPSAAANLTIDGALTSTINGNVVYAPSQSSTAATADQAWARRIGVSSSGDCSGVTFTITGTDVDGKALSETITGPAASAVVYTGATVAALFKTVTKVAISAAGTGNITVGTAAVSAHLYARPIGILPYQSSISNIKVMMIEGLNSATSDAIEIGKSDDPDYLADIADAIVTAVTTTANTGGAVTVDATQSSDWRSVSQSDTGSDSVAYNSDVQVVMTLTPTGTLATAGIGYISVDFMQGRNLIAGETW